MIVITRDVFCDNLCGNWFAGGPDETLTAVRTRAKRFGWSYVNGNDLCPRHTKEGAKSHDR